MSPQAQRALSIAACIGDQFDLISLSLLREKSLVAAASELWEALRAGLVVPTSSSYRFVHSHAADDDAERASSAVQNPVYKFLHDRVKQAAHSLLPDGEDQRIHLQIGRLMASGALRPITSDEVFEIARHMNAGAALISDEAERAALARQNLAAGKKAKAATAYQAASLYLKFGVSLLGERARERDARLAFELSIELSECEYLSGLFGEAERLFEDVFSQATSDLDRARVYDLRMVLYITQGRVAEAVRVGLDALAMFGAPLPETEPEQRALLEGELAEAQASLSGRPIGDLIDAPEMTDPTKKALLRILTSFDAPAYQTSPALHALVVLKKVNLSLRHGHSELSAFAYMTYGWLLASSMGRYLEGYEFGDVALKLNELFKGTELTCKLNGIFGSFTHYVKPLRSRIQYLRRAYQAGLESGDFPYLSYNCFHTVLLRLGLGDELSIVREEIDKFLAFMRRTRDAPSTAVLTLARQVVLSLEGRTRDRSTLSDSAFDEEAFVSSVRSSGFIACAYFTLKAWLLYLYGLHNEALSAVLMADDYAASGGGFYYTTELAFFACLVVLAPEEAAGRRHALLDKYAPKLAEWALRCPSNYEHMHKLVSAEVARASGQDLLASQLYDEAARLAGENGFPHHQALANELAARFYLHLGRERFAQAYLGEAYAGYQAWGARAKLEELGEELGDLAVPKEAKGHARESIIDVMTVMKASQAISEEIDEEQLLQRLMTVVIESAGAERGCLLVESGDGLSAIAEGRVGSGRIEVARTGPEGPSAVIPASIVSLVRKTRERVVIDDAAADARFSEDPVVAELRPKSILCMPLLRQGALAGVLYLENNLVTAAFSHGQLVALELLSSQAAISLDNARLYAELRRENAERRRTEAELVEQLEVIRRQREAIRVLSTPIIEVWDGVLTIPLLGALDAERAASMITSILEALSRKRYQCVIVDLTGVESIDAATGEHVARLIGAVRLLGARGIVAGIRPEVARSIIASGIHLPNVATLANLREALLFYLRSYRGGAGAARPRPHGERS
jgi:GAF domain-containing protein/anti-anti-sigma regulatory factor